jgi:hypothetical protein
MPPPRYSNQKARDPVAQQRPTIECEDMPLDEARRMSCGPRMNLLLSHALREKFQSLDNAATCMSLPEGTSPTTMKNRILRVAAELNIPVTVRKIPGGRIFWRSTAEDLQQATEVAQRLRTTQRPGRTRPGRHLRA